MTRGALIRVALAGPGAAVVAALVMLAMPLWVPAGAARVDNLVVPLAVFPLVWVALFFHACLDPRLARVGGIALILAGASGALLGWHFIR